MPRKQTGKKKTPAKRPGAAAPRTGRPSSLLDTHIVYCGDRHDQLAKLPDACVDRIYIDSPFNSNRNYEVFRRDLSEPSVLGGSGSGPLPAFEHRHASTQAYIDVTEDPKALVCG